MTDLSDTFIKALPDLTLVVRRDGLILSNLGGRELGITTQPGALRGKSLADLWTADVAEELAKLLRRSLKGRAQVDGRFSHDNRRVDVRVRPQGVDRVLMIMRPLPAGTQTRPESAIADAASLHDPGDCATFARKLCDAIGNAQLRERQAALTVVHFGGLPAIANAFGTPVGGLLVTAALERLATLDPDNKLKLVRPLRAAQLESDQLAVLIEETAGREAAKRVAEKIRSTLAEPIELDGHRHELDPIVGLALFPADGREPDALLDRARGAILEAHREGRSTSVAACADTMTVEAISMSDLEQELRWALEREQFSLEYAPILELSGRRTTAVTALLHWVHPVCGRVPRKQFLPLLDTLDLRCSLDRWTVRRGCRDLALLNERGSTRLNLAVRLARQSLDTTGFIEDIAAAAAAADISLSRLDIDIDLRTLAAGSRIRGHLRELRQRGARIFLENFGEDGIALARLSSLPLDGLKIAPAFVTRLDQDVNARTVCSAAVSIARIFGLECVAVGVVSRAQLEILYESGCEQASGPLFSASRPASELCMVSSSWPSCEPLAQSRAAATG